MNVKAKLLTALTAAAIGCGLSFSASADDGWKRHHRGHPHYKQHNHHGHHVYGHAYYPVVTRPVYVERPVYYVERPVYVERHVHYAPPVRHPGVVVSVAIPPIVFPIR